MKWKAVWCVSAPDDNVLLGDNAETAAQIENDGRTVVFVAVDATLIGWLAIADRIKPEAYMVVQALRTRGLQVAMVTGDTRATAQSVARQLHIEQVHAEVLPQDKAKVVTQFAGTGPTGRFRRRWYQ